jgi:chorismate synthase
MAQNSNGLIDQLKVQLQTQEKYIEKLMTELEELEVSKNDFLQKHQEKVENVQRKITQATKEKETLGNAIQILEAQLPPVEIDTSAPPPEEQPQ